MFHVHTSTAEAEAPIAHIEHAPPVPGIACLGPMYNSDYHIARGRRLRGSAVTRSAATGGPGAPGQ